MPLALALAVAVAVAVQVPTGAYAEAIDESLLDDATTVVAEICANLPDGCDRSRIDPLDPLGEYFGFEDSGTLSPTESSGSTKNTNDFPRDTSRGAFTNMNIKKPTLADGSPIPVKGIVGVDFALADKYRPCGNADDPYNGACLNPGNPGSYLRSHSWAAGDGGTDYGAGIFVGNFSRRQSCPQPCEHFWGQRVQRIDVEFYPRSFNSSTGKDETNSNYVRARTASFGPEFTQKANGGTYTPAYGTVPLPRLGESGTSRLAGFITRNGVAVAAGGASVRIFQEGSTGKTSGGKALQAFATPNTAGNNGFYGTGAIYSGNYTIRVVDQSTKKCLRFKDVNLTTTSRIDWRLEQRGFGRAGSLHCTREEPAA